MVKVALWVPLEAKPRMECRDVRDKVDTFLAQEWLTEPNHEFLRHLDTCPACRADLVARRVLRQSVRRAFQNACDLDPTPGFTMRLRATLHEAAQHDPLRRGIEFHGWWALAATLLAATVLAAVALGLALPSHQDER